MKLITCFSLCFLLFFACQADRSELRQNPANNVPEPAPAHSAGSVTTSAPKAPPTTEDISADDRTFVPNERLGKITAATTPERLVAFYGPENVREDSIYLGEGYFLEGYKLFPGTSSEISLLYPGGEVELRDMQLTIDGNATDWVGQQTGVRIGTTLEELVRINGGDFTFMGFDWDYGGVVTDWRGGALKDYRVRLGYDYENRKNIALHPTIVGDVKTVTNNPALKDLEVKVIQIIVRLPEGE